MRERGLKYATITQVQIIINVAPVRERGLKYNISHFLLL